MPTDVLNIASDLSLEADYIAGASIALLGKRGAGKTYASRVLAESLFDAGVQTVIIDPMGAFWGLRSSADGEMEGLPVPVFGGDHGDVALEASAGSLMADLVVEEGLSMILDLSGFGSRTQERTFVATFLDRLYRTNKDLVHLIVDEADLFAPQKPRREDAHLLVTMENIVRRGRNKGIGITMATQRAAVLNKDVLTQIDALVALRVAAPQDRDAITDWVRGQGDEDTWSKIAPSLPGLANGECWWWIPEIGILQQVQVRKTRTFDSSPTRKRGHASRAPKTFADVDLRAISDRISATIERAKATDPRALTKRIADLERILDSHQPSTTKPTVVEVATLDKDLVTSLESACAALVENSAHTEAVMHDLLTAVQQTVSDAGAHTAAITKAATTLTEAIRAASSRPLAAPAPPTGPVRPTRSAPPLPTAPKSSQPLRPSTPSGEDPISPARFRLLTALASLESIGVNEAPKTQLALWAGVSPKSSGFANNLGALRTAGLIDYPSSGRVTLTTEGRSVAGPTETLANSAELHSKVQSLISPARWRILAALIEVYPNSLSKADLASAAGVSAASSGFANNLGALRSLGLLDYPTPGLVAATPVLFIAGH